MSPSEALRWVKIVAAKLRRQGDDNNADGLEEAVIVLIEAAKNSPDLPRNHFVADPDPEC